MNLDDLRVEVWPPAVATATAHFHQGSLLKSIPFVLVGDPKNPTTRLTENNSSGLPMSLRPHERPPYAVITSQSCDVDEAGKPANPFIQCAPVVNILDRLSSGRDNTIKNGGFADLIYLTSQPESDGFWVADMRYIGSVEKGLLVGQTPREGFTTEADRLIFADRLAQRVGRAAFSGPVQDAVVTSLNNWIAKNYGRQSQRGRATFTGVEEVCLRVEGDRLHPTSVQGVVFQETILGGEDIAAWNAWRDRANGDLKTHPENTLSPATFLKPIQFATLAMPASVYRTLTPVSIPALQRGPR